ncbi:hypothetical protein MSPP1_003799 [Malassezia sp. CBS 17886]|nr:hypothetical protein MSPP1_003799 [Malassezia sp. CBS 17886]
MEPGEGADVRGDSSVPSVPARGPGTSPTRRAPPTLQSIASRFHKGGVTDENAVARAPKTSRGRLGLAGRLGDAGTTPAAQATPWSKSAMPSLSEIRARLNQRGVDVTSSKWSPRRGSQGTDSDGDGDAVQELTGRDVDSPHGTSEAAGASTDPQPETEAAAVDRPHSAASDAAHTRVPSPSPPRAGADLSAPLSRSRMPDDGPHSTAPPQDTTTKTPTPDGACMRPQTDAPQPARAASGGDAAASATAPLCGRTAAEAAKAGKRHPLQHPWTLYYDYQRYHGASSSTQYEATLRCVGEFSTLESFFDTFATLHRPSRLEKNANYHLFRDGIKPMWEDPANAQGGRWVLTLRDRGQTAGSRAAHDALLDRSWMWLVLGLIGEHFDEDNDVTGAVCSLRGKGDRISLWLRRQKPVDRVNALGTKLLELLELHEGEGNVSLEFSTNTGTKAEGYMTHRHQQAADGDAVHEAPGPETVLGSWLGSDATLHPKDHVHVFQGK